MITERIGSYFMWIQGFRNAEVADSEKALHDLRGFLDGIELELLRADRIGGIEHLVFAARNAVDSFTGKDRRAKHLSMEFLLFASGEHQIVEAIKFLGVNKSSTEIALVGFSDDNTDFGALTDKSSYVVKGSSEAYVVEVRSAAIADGLTTAYTVSAKPQIS